MDLVLKEPADSRVKQQVRSGFNSRESKSVSLLYFVPHYYYCVKVLKREWTQISMFLKKESTEISCEISCSNSCWMLMNWTMNDYVPSLVVNCSNTQKLDYCSFFAPAAVTDFQRLKCPIVWPVGGAIEQRTAQTVGSRSHSERRPQNVLTLPLLAAARRHVPVFCMTTAGY